MAKPEPPDPISSLVPAIEVLTGRPVRVEEVQRFHSYLHVLVEWNRTHGLTAIRSPGGIVTGLFQDALLFLALLPPAPIRVVDLGTGPGIPGIPLRIVREDISLTLVEAKRRRVSFLATLKRDLRLTDLSVLEGRAEQLVAQHPELEEAFDVAVSRAVGGAALLPTALRYVKPGGLFIAGGSPRSEDILKLEDLPELVRETRVFDALRLRRTFLLCRKPA